MSLFRRGMNAGLTGIMIAAAGCATAPGTAHLPPTSAHIAPAHDGWPLLPVPRTMEVGGSAAGLDPAGDLELDAFPPVLGGALADAIHAFPRAKGRTLQSRRHRIAIDPARVPGAQGYEIVIAAGRAGAELAVTAHDEAGLFYAAQTLRQLATLSRERGEIPLCRIADHPDFPNRGVMLDVARDKVPEMKTLYELVDLFASWKYNQLQLYTEHTFAYKGHHAVWEDASPMTPAQVRDLDRYCRERYVQLVPNQNSFGHMNRWLSRPEYADLAETPNGSDLCPVDPRSIALLRSMYTFMLPNFSSPYFNVGCDETWSLGKGRSKEAVEQRGVGRVYLEFLLRIRDVVQENGKSMQFWADIINNHPELIPELPKDLVAMEWGYEANHPYAEHTKRFHDNGVRFYVVPGTSSWNTLLGRTENALGNIRNAAENGIAHGGEGFLMTDWGDGGHWQFQPVSYVPFLYGAALSWCFTSNEDLDPAAMADRYAFFDAAGVMGKAACDLGNAYKQTGMEFGNNTVFYMLLQHRVEKPLNTDGFERLKAEDLDKTIAFIDNAIARIEGADMKGPDAGLIKAEFQMNAALAKFACRLGAARIRAGGVATSALPPEQRLQLAAELEPLIPEFRQLWLARNRSGGLKDSAGRFERLLALLK
ncbi:MAG: family 20 glycosylhydrolase [Candidatus Hydrogenedentes bacterium]|nr:family 20 glycosylhydrolase [Candidatus Hydrogenedentota bacterium]